MDKPQLQLVEVDVAGAVRAGLIEMDTRPDSAEIRATLQQFMARHGDEATDLESWLAELFEVSEDEIIGAVSDWCDQRVIAGDAPEVVVAHLKRLQVAFSACLAPLNGSVDLRPLIKQAKPRAAKPLPPDASHERVVSRVLAGPYHRTVLRRLYPLGGFIPLREVWLAVLELQHANEPAVAALLASFETKEIKDMQSEIIEPLLKLK